MVLKHVIALFVKENGLGSTLTGPSLDMSVMDEGEAVFPPPSLFFGLLCHLVARTDFHGTIDFTRGGWGLN